MLIVAVLEHALEREAVGANLVRPRLDPDSAGAAHRGHRLTVAVGRQIELETPAGKAYGAVGQWSRFGVVCNEWGNFDFPVGR